jgi:hypothetical protein
MQLLADLLAVQLTPTGRSHWDITAEEKFADTSQILL